MKTALSLRLLRLALFCTAAMLTLATGTSAFAEGRATKSRPLRLPPIFVESNELNPPALNSDGSITLPDGTVIAPPVRNSDGSITLPDGSILSLPSRGNSDGTVMLPDGTVVTRNSDGTVTLPDGSVIAAPEHSDDQRSSTGT